MTEFDLTPPSSAQRDAIIAGLTAEEHDVLLEHGTEAAFCGVFLDNHKDGVYTCRFCGLPLFRSSAKFDSGTGWPSFFKPYNEAHIRRVRDRRSVHAAGAISGTFFRTARRRPAGVIASTPYHCRLQSRERHCRTCSGVDLRKGKYSRSSGPLRSSTWLHPLPRDPVVDDRRFSHYRRT